VTSEVVPFKPEHLESLDEDTFNLLGLTQDWFEKAKLFNNNGTCYSGFVNDEFVACAGITLMWSGVGEAWAVVTPKIKKYPVFFHKEVTRKLNTLIKKHKLHRVQATVFAEFQKGKRWAERLGFKAEGIMHKYDPEGLDHIRYAKVI
jgi:hypothetical protein